MFKKRVAALAFLTVLAAFWASSTSTVSDPAETGIFSGGYSLLSDDDYVISPYDELMRGICEPEGHDWRLMSAIAYHESRFRSYLVSPRGARGLMQIMPSVARQFGVPVETAADPTTNVWLACKLLTRIEEGLYMACGTPDEDRLRIVLASYNSGLGHIKDARRLARFYGENPDSWEVVKHYLRMKSRPEFYRHRVVECGRFAGSRQTQAYVDDVVEHYRIYCCMAER